MGLLVTYVLLAVLVAVLVAYAISLRNDWRNRHVVAALKASLDPEQHRRRLLGPQAWDFLEHHLARPVPAALREIYADHDLIQRRDVRYSDDLVFECFTPIEENSFIVGSDLAPTLAHDVVPIVRTEDMHFHAFLKPGRDEPDIVFVAGEGEECELAPIDVFVQRIRAATTA